MTAAEMVRLTLDEAERAHRRTLLTDDEMEAYHHVWLCDAPRLESYPESWRVEPTRPEVRVIVDAMRVAIAERDGKAEVFR